MAGLHDAWSVLKHTCAFIIRMYLE